MGNYRDRNLLENVPNVLREVREFQALSAGEQPEVYRLFEQIDLVLQNQFITTANVFGVSRWEELLGIVPKATATLEERKFTILSRLAEELPYTEKMLEQMFEKLCGATGYAVRMDPESFSLWVRVALTAKRNFEDVKTLLNRVLPAHIIVDLSLMYNQHQQLIGITHGGLHALSHHDIRETPFA